jgi:Protein of unknown function (DUF3822)
LKQLFHITAGEGKESMQPVLSIRVGERHCCFSIADFTTQELQELAYYTIDEVNDFFLTELFLMHPELNGHFYQVLVCYDYPQSALVPLKYYKQEDEALLLKTMFGINGTAAVISEAVTDWQLYNIYGVPKEVQGWISRKFPAAKYWHQYSISLKNIHTAETGGSLLVDLRNDDFTVVAAAHNKLLLAQTFLYSTPIDVIYSLLKICQQFNLSQQEVNIQLSGLVERQSALYRELYSYFIRLRFRDADWMIKTAFNGVSPPHFFTSLNDLSRCAS